MDALISGSAGIAVAFLDHGAVASMHAGDPGRLVRRSPAELRVLLQDRSGFARVSDVSEGELGEQLARARRREELVSLALVAVDAELPADLRRDALASLAPMLFDRQALDDLERVLYAHPLPDGHALDFARQESRGRCGEPIATLFDQLWRNQLRIGLVREAWASLPIASPGWREMYPQWQFTAVGAGCFRALVQCWGDRTSHRRWLAVAVGNRRLRALPFARETLTQWAAAVEARWDRDPWYRAAEPLPLAASELREPAATYDATEAEPAVADADESGRPMAPEPAAPRAPAEAGFPVEPSDLAEPAR